MTHAYVRRIGAAALLVLGTLVMVVATPGTASAAPCEVGGEYAGSATIIVEPPGTISPGQAITIIGEGWPPNCEVDIIINGTLVGTVTTSSDGTFSFGYTIGANVCGDVSIGAAAGAFSRGVMKMSVCDTTPATVTPAATGDLPRTGSDSGWMVGAGIGLVAVGGLLLLATRKRQHAPAA